MSETTQAEHTMESLLKQSHQQNSLWLSMMIDENLFQSWYRDEKQGQFYEDLNALHQIEKSLTKSEWERYTDQIRLYLQERYNTGFYGEPEEKIAEWTRKLEAHEICMLLILTLQSAEPEDGKTSLQ